MDKQLLKTVLRSLSHPLQRRQSDLHTLEDETVLDFPLLGPELKRRISENEATDGYAIAWDGPEDRMIFIQSQNKKTHGLGDASFVTAPGRNASILNSITGKEVYRIDHSDRLVALR